MYVFREELNEPEGWEGFIPKWKDRTEEDSADGGGEAGSVEVEWCAGPENRQSRTRTRRGAGCLSASKLFSQLFTGLSLSPWRWQDNTEADVICLSQEGCVLSVHTGQLVTSRTWRLKASHDGHESLVASCFNIPQTGSLLDHLSFPSLSLSLSLSFSAPLLSE